jgi:hypothetical protein
VGAAIHAFATRLTQTLISDYDTFQKPQAEGKLSDFGLTKELKLALAHIKEAEDLLNDASSSIQYKLVQSRNIISYLIRCIDYSSL